MHDLPIIKPNKIEFKYSTGPYGFLSNFSAHPIEYQGEKYPTSEHFYQSCKLLEGHERAAVRKASTPKAAKAVANSMKEYWRSDWHRNKVGVMLETLLLKVEQHPEIKQKLLDSGNTELIESSVYDDFWGDGPDKNGVNMLGKLWMIVRDIARYSNESK